MLIPCPHANSVTCQSAASDPPTTLLGCTWSWPMASTNFTTESVNKSTFLILIPGRVSGGFFDERFPWIRSVLFYMTNRAIDQIKSVLIAFSQ
jgi:hypothetical protein